MGEDVYKRQVAVYGNALGFSVVGDDNLLLVFGAKVETKACCTLWSKCGLDIIKLAGNILQDILGVRSDRCV